jgi:hypothetical protein
MSKQDRQGARNVSEFEQRYNFNKKFSEIMGIATDARNLALEAQKSYDGLSHEQIFNLLTNDGALEGLYEANGQVYINASYIKSGELSADLIKTGVIKSANYKELTDGTPYLGMAIDLDNGIINSPKFKLNNLGEITATGGFLGEFEITADGLFKATMETTDRDVTTDSVSITPHIISMESASVETATGSYYNAKTHIQSGILSVGKNHDHGEFYGNIMNYMENGQRYSIYIDRQSGTVKAKLLTAGASEG